MNRLPKVEGPPLHPAPSRRVGVHVLSEHVFCARAGTLALESEGQDQGEEGTHLGPRLNGFCYDYDAARFDEAIQNDWGELRRWLTWLAPAVLLPFAAWRLYSGMAALLVSLPMFWVATRMREAVKTLILHIRARNIYRAASKVTIDMAPTNLIKVDWWSLRKAGFDCHKPVDAYRDDQLVGRPWRVLVKDTMWRIPVIRKHRGEAVCHTQHIVRAAAYCQLVETCEGGRAPFAVLLFGGTYDCVIIPNNAASQRELAQALEDFSEFLRIHAGGRFIPEVPSDNRCRGCHWGSPRPMSEPTILKGQTLWPLRIEGIRKGEFHCPCGDRFYFVPLHADIQRLRGERT
jgi:hypothetical protein